MFQGVQEFCSLCQPQERAVPRVALSISESLTCACMPKRSSSWGRSSPSSGLPENIGSAHSTDRCTELVGAAAFTFLSAGTNCAGKHVTALTPTEPHTHHRHLVPAMQETCKEQNRQGGQQAGSSAAGSCHSLQPLQPPPAPKTHIRTHACSQHTPVLTHTSLNRAARTRPFPTCHMVSTETTDLSRPG